MRHIRSALWLASALALGCAKEDTKPVVGVLLTSPANGIHLQGGMVRVEIGYRDNAPDRLELLRDGTAIAELVLPTYWYSWNVGVEPEGEHQLVARAWLGDSSFDSAPVTVVVDRTPPTAVGVAPLFNHRARWPFYITLSEDVIVEPGDVVVTRDGGVPVEVVVSTWPHVGAASAWPVSPVETPATVTMKLDGVTDLAGNPLPVTERVFEVPAWWQPDTAIGHATSLVAPSTPSIATAGGWVYFAWDLYYERCNDGGFCQWGAHLGGPMSLAAAGPDRMLAAYPASVDGSGIWLRTWSTTGALELVADPFPGPSHSHGYALGARATTGGGDDALVTWHTAAGSPMAISVHAARLVDGIWSSLGRVAGNLEGTIWAWSEAAALSPDGTAWVAVTQELDAATSATGVGVYRFDGTNWLLAGTTRGTHAGAPSLALDADGTPYVAYADWSSGDVLVERWNGSTWTSLGVVEPDPAESASSPSLALDVGGAPVVALTSHATGLAAEQRAWVRRWNGTGWETIGTALNLGVPVRAVQEPALALDSDGGVFVAFHEWTGDGELTSTPPAVPTATWDLRVVQLNR